jgi:hypothetical protein
VISKLAPMELARKLAPIVLSPVRRGHVGVYRPALDRPAHVARPDSGVPPCCRRADLEVVVAQPIRVRDQKLRLTPTGARRAHARHRQLHQPSRDTTGDQPDRQRHRVVVGGGGTGQDQVLHPVGVLGGEPQGVQPTERVPDDRCNGHTDAIEQLPDDLCHMPQPVLDRCMVEFVGGSVARPLHRVAPELVLELRHERHPLGAVRHPAVHQDERRPLPRLENLAPDPRRSDLGPPRRGEVILRVPSPQPTELVHPPLPVKLTRC